MTLQAMTIDRTDWAKGPWDLEPDDDESFTAHGLACRLLRAPLGHWCGYVTLPDGHPALGVDTDELNSLLSVHGGITYFVSAEIGFDCAHVFDVVPARCLNLTAFEYRTQVYARVETTELARQLADPDLGYRLDALRAQKLAEVLR